MVDFYGKCTIQEDPMGLEIGLCTFASVNFLRKKNCEEFAGWSLSQVVLFNW